MRLGSCQRACLVSAEDTTHTPVIPGLSTYVGTMIYTGNIGTQIASEFDTYRCVWARVRLGSCQLGEKLILPLLSRLSLSPTIGAPSPFGAPQEKSSLISSQTSQSVSGDFSTEVHSCALTCNGFALSDMYIYII